MNTMNFRVVSLILALCSFERCKSNQSILDDFQCFDEPVPIPSDYPPVAIMMCGYSSQCATNMAAYVFMKEVLGINVTFYPTTSYDDIWDSRHWDNWQSDAYPRNYFEWIANDDMDLNFEVWP
eukprot:239219_1